MAAASTSQKSLLQLAGPLVLSFVLRDAFAWVDMLFAANLPGPQASNDPSVAAIGLTQPFQFLMIACWVGTSNALTSRLSAAMGAGQDAKFEQLLRSAWRMVFVLVGAFALIAAGIWFGAGLWGLDPEPERQFRVYGTVLLLGSSVTTFWSILPDSIVKAHHDMRSTMWAGIASSVLNTVLNAVFVFVFGWGILGIALATVLGRIGGLAYAVRVANRLEAARRGESAGTDPTLALKPIRDLLAIAVPSGLSFALMGAESMAINKILAARPDATSVLAAFALVDRAGRSLSMPIIALGVAMLPLAARKWGGGDVAGIRRELVGGLRLAGIYGVAFVLPVVWLFRGPFASVMSDEESTREALVLALRWLPLGVVLGSPMFLLRTTFEGMQKPMPGLAGSVLRAVVLSVPLGWLGLRYAPEVGLAPLEGLVIGMSTGTGLASLAMWVWIRGWFARCRGDHAAD